MIRTHRPYSNYSATSDKQPSCNWFSEEVSLLPSSSKIFEKLTFNSLYKCVEENLLLCSWFRKSDSCVNQLLSIVDETLIINCLSFETHSEFSLLEMSKVFDRVWHESFVYKMKSLGISNNILKLL